MKPVYNKLDILKAFQRLNIINGDSVFLTSNLGMLGKPDTKNKNLLKVSSTWILEVLKELIGRKGNIFVPVYSYSFTKKRKVFSPKSTRSEVGYFSNFFLKQKKIIRSNDPMMSIAGYGPNVKNILLKASNSSFGDNCVFERFLKLNKLKCCHISLGINWIPFLHYLDWKNKVPFRFNKILSGYLINGKKRKKIKWIFYARYLRKETIADGYKIGNKAVKEKLYISQKLGNSKIYVINYKSFFNFSKKITNYNKWLTIEGPRFKI
jgi:aminoglycoside N3'-acetyltransferase